MYLKYQQYQQLPLYHQMPTRQYFKKTLITVLVITCVVQVLRMHRPHAYHHEKQWLDPILNETLGFEKILAINLPERTDKRDATSLSARLTGFKVDYVLGVRGEDIDDKALPPNTLEKIGTVGSRGAWRGHMDALRTIVEENLSSALIMEDDVDWDIRIKSQLQKIALGTTALTQPKISNRTEYLDPSYPESTGHDSHTEVFITSEQNPPIHAPEASPYGDSWDLLWLGHCGMRTPTPDDNNKKGIPLGRAVITPDETVPEKQYLPMRFENTEWQRDLESYPPHTRIVTRAMGGICTLAYAVSQQGARKLLYELSLNRLDAPYDLALMGTCENNRDTHFTCLGVLPAVFQHHRPAGPMHSYSDIDDAGHDVNQRAYTRDIRWSTRLNMQKLVSGDTDYIDQYPDGKELFLNDHQW